MIGGEVEDARNSSVLKRRRRPLLQAAEWDDAKVDNPLLAEEGTQRIGVDNWTSRGRRNHGWDDVRGGTTHDCAEVESDDERRSRRRIEEALNVGTCSEGRVEPQAGGRLAGRDVVGGAARGAAPWRERGRGG